MSTVSDPTAVKKEKHIFYVSVGAKEIYYTLRKMVIKTSGQISDDYVCTLSANKDEAITKAKDYFSSTAILLNNGDINLILSLKPEYNTSQKFKSKKVLSDDRITQIENGITPIGCYRGFKICELPEHYLIWLADQYTGEANTANDRVFQTLASVALNLVLERNLFNKDSVEKTTACPLGTIGERVKFCALIQEYDVSISFYGNVLSYTLLVDGKIVKYRGSKFIGAKGETINLKATIDEHLTVEDGSEVTFIKRPSLI
ncbi:DUF3820 family protein [Acinetobacter baumannii]